MGKNHEGKRIEHHIIKNALRRSKNHYQYVLQMAWWREIPRKCSKIQVIKQSRKHEFLDVTTMRRLYDFWKQARQKTKTATNYFWVEKNTLYSVTLVCFSSCTWVMGRILPTHYDAPMTNLCTMLPTANSYVSFATRLVKETRVPAKWYFRVTSEIQRLLTDTAMFPNSEGEYSQ